MILVDANILICAKDKLNGLARVGLPWTCLLAFMPIVTNPRIISRPQP